MAVISTEDTAETIANLITRIRRALGDTDATAANNRWTDAEIIDALNLEIFKMTAEMGIGNTTAMLTSDNMTYTASATSVALPSGPDVNPIFMVEDITNSSQPVRLEFASILEADDYLLTGTYVGSKGRRWSRIGGNLAVRPLPGSALTLRIWSLRAPYGTSTSYAGTDQQPFPVAHEELLSVGAAIRLQETDGEISPGRVQRYIDLWQRFVRSKYQNRGRIYVSQNRRYR